jgi:beta-galactosidase
MIGKTFLHGGDYNPEQCNEEIWLEDMRLAKLANVNTMTVGIFSWSMLELKEGQYDFHWLDRIFELLNENGMKAVLASPSAAQPRWMSEKYPEVLRTKHDRVRQEHRVRVNYCLTSPIYRRKCAEMTRLLAERYGRNPALIMWHVSNEYHGDCHCELCQDAFRVWLEKRYKTLENLNDAWCTAFWSHRYSDWSEIRSPQPWPEGEWSMLSLGMAWKRFFNDQTISFFHNEADVMREITPSVPVTSNIHTWDMNWKLLADAVDIVSYDSYPKFEANNGDCFKGLNASFKYDYMRGFKRKPFILMENNPSSPPGKKLRRPGYHITKAMQAVSAGSDSVMYFQWRNVPNDVEMFHGAVVNHDGRSDTRAFREVSKVGELLEDIKDVCGTSIDAQVALIYDEENHWGVEFSTTARWDERSYDNQVRDHYRAFWNRGIAVDVISSLADFSSYKILVAPVLYMLLPGVAECITEFVEKGGTFVTTFWSGYVNEENKAIFGGAPGALSEVLGIRSEELDACDNAMEFNGKIWKTLLFAEIIHPEGADVISTFKNEFYAGAPALTCNSYGLGKAYYMCAAHDENFMNEFYGRLIKDAGVKTLYDRPLPKGMTCRERGGKLFIMNFAPISNEVTLPGGKTIVIDAGQTVIV